MLLIRGIPSSSWILVFTLLMVSEDSTSSMVVLPVMVFTKICIVDGYEKTAKNKRI